MAQRGDSVGETDSVAQRSEGDLERLGESDEWAKCLLFLLRHAGWSCAAHSGLGGGHLVVARRRGVEVRQQADTLSDAAHGAFQAAFRTRAPITAA